MGCMTRRWKWRGAASCRPVCLTSACRCVKDGSIPYFQSKHVCCQKEMDMAWSCFLQSGLPASSMLMLQGRLHSSVRSCHGGTHFSVEACLLPKGDGHGVELFLTVWPACVEHVDASRSAPFLSAFMSWWHAFFSRSMFAAKRRWTWRGAVSYSLACLRRAC